MITSTSDGGDQASGRIFLHRFGHPRVWVEHLESSFIYESVLIRRDFRRFRVILGAMILKCASAGFLRIHALMSSQVARDTTPAY